MNAFPTVLVTGADGLLGRHTVRSLKDAGMCRLTAVSRRPHAGPAQGKEFVRADLLRPQDVEALSGIGADIIVHTAAVLPRTLDDQQAAEANRLMDKHVFALARRTSASVVYLSSLSVYEGCALPWRESTEVQPRSAYAAGKHRSELEAEALGVPVVALRISSPYSAATPERPGVLYHFTREAVAQRPLVVAGQGLRTQDFVHGADVARAIIAVIRRWIGQPAQAISEVFNIAGGQPVSMVDLARLVVAICGTGTVRHEGSEPEPAFHADMPVTLAWDLLTWQPQVALRTGLEQLVRHLRGAHEDWLAV